LYHFLFVFLSFHICHFIVRRVWRHQRVNPNPYIEEEQTTQWPKGKVQKDKQRSTKHTFCTYKTKDRVTPKPTKTGGKLRCSGRVSSSCSTSDTRRVNLVTNPVKSNELEKDREVLTTSCPSFYDLRLSDYHVYPPKVSFNFYQVSVICRHIIGVFIILVFSRSCIETIH
jgi:hypothetical protein